MKALLDENMPKALVRLLAPEIEARTVQQEGWSGRKNGDLLAAAAETFDLLGHPAPAERGALRHRDRAPGSA